MKIRQGNALELPYGDATVDIVVTSPPYWKNRVYGASGEEIGIEKELSDYLAKMRRVLAEIKRVLKPDTGVCWFNIGDTACVDTDTRIFTQRGWLAYDEVRVGDKTLTLKDPNGAAEWGDILQLHVSDESILPMLSMESDRGHSSLTTLNHRWLVERRTSVSHGQSRPGEMNASAKLNPESVETVKALSASGLKQSEVAEMVGVSQSAVSRILTGKAWVTPIPAEKERYKNGRIVREMVTDWVHSEDLTTTDCRVPVSRLVSNLPTTKTHEDALVEAVAWYWTEGHDRSLYGGRGIWITQSAKVHPSFCDEISSCLQSLFGDKTERLASGPEPLWRLDESRLSTDGVLTWKLNGAAADTIRVHAPGKAVTPDFICSLTQDQLDLFLDVSVKGDGHLNSDGSVELSQSNQSDNSIRAKLRSESFQYAATLAGRYATLRSIQSSPDTRSTRNWVPHERWGVYLGAKKNFVPSRTKSSIVLYAGRVWCPTTANGSWLAMRNGVPFFTGNSGSGGAGGDYGKAGKYSARPKYTAGRSGLPKGQWCNVPAKLSIVAQEDCGFLLRNEIVWDKEICRPESEAHVRRHLLQHEKIFMFTTGMKYHYNSGVARERGNVWRFRPEKNKKLHYAPYPDELVERCLEVTGFPGAVVLDPFSGSGTTPRVAEQMGMEGWGVELYAS